SPRYVMERIVLAHPRDIFPGFVLNHEARLADPAGERLDRFEAAPDRQPTHAVRGCHRTHRRGLPEPSCGIPANAAIVCTHPCRPRFAGERCMGGAWPRSGGQEMRAYDNGLRRDDGSW